MAKAIVDVVINDSAWQAFNRQVDAHREKLKALPGQWGAVGKSVEKASSAAAKLVARMAEQNRAFKEANGATGKMIVGLKAADRALASMVRNSVGFLRNIKDATKSILSWMPMFGIISGILGAGGLFGLSRLAGSVAQGQQSALGAGASYGGTKAAGISFAPAFGGAGGVESLMNQIAQEQRSGGVMFRRLGMAESQWKGKESSDVLAPLLRALQAKYKEGPESTAVQRMGAYAPGMDFNTILRISKLNVETMEQEYNARKKALDLSRGTQDSWARFHRALEYAADKLENIFARALGGKLLGALESFSNGLLKAANTLANSKLVKNLIEGAGGALQKAANYLNSPEFESDFKNFMHNMEEIGKAVVSLAKTINDWVGGPSAEERSSMEARKISDEMERRRKAQEAMFPPVPAGGYAPARPAAAGRGGNMNHIAKVELHVHSPTSGQLGYQVKGASVGNGK